MKISLDATVAIMIAVGTLRVGFLASSDNVDTASKPRNACTAMMRKLALATETMPTMLSTVTTAIATRMITHAGIAGIAASR
jgi:hypothetical protein